MKAKSVFYYVFCGTLSLIATVIILGVALFFLTAITAGVVEVATKKPAAEEESKPWAPQPSTPSTPLFNASAPTVQRPSTPRPPTQDELITASAVVAEQEKQNYLIEADTVALKWQIKRAAAGFASAQFDLGVRYLTGSGVLQDEVLGKQMIKNAADQGYAYAIKKLKTLP